MTERVNNKRFRRAINIDRQIIVLEKDIDHRRKIVAGHRKALIKLEQRLANLEEKKQKILEEVT